MILVDTCIWADHLRRGDAVLQAMMMERQVVIHPLVIGEIAMGRVQPRHVILGSLHALPHVVQASHEEALAFIERHNLAGTGIGYVDAHLLASARLSHALLWTCDKRLLAVAIRLGLAYHAH